MTTQEISLSQITPSVHQQIKAVQGDTGRQLRMNITDRYFSSATAGLYFERSDHTNYSVSCALINGSFEADITQALTQPGVTKCQLKVTESNKVVSTYTFQILVEKNVTGTATPQENYTIEEALSKAEQAVTTADQAVETANNLVEELQDDIDSFEHLQETLDNKANIDGSYSSLTSGLSEQILSKNRTIDQTPYLYRQTALGKANATRALMRKIVGGSVVWNQLCNGSSVTVPNGHKYAAKIGGSWSISASAGTAITGLTAGTDMVTDLTALFGSATIAGYIYSLEQATAGSGIAKLREWGFFTKDYYEYDAGTMKSVEGVSAKITRDADANVIGNYPLDSTKEWRGIFKLDADNNLYADGDIYPPSGEVSRRYALIDFGTLDWRYINIEGHRRFIFNFAPVNCAPPTPAKANAMCNRYEVFTNGEIFNNEKIGIAIHSDGTQILVYDPTYADAATFKTAMSGVMLLYELATPTTETAEPYTEVQVVDKDGTEEFVTSGIVPVGHYTEYPDDLVGKLDSIPALPSANGNYVLQATVNSGVVTYTWVTA